MSETSAAIEASPEVTGQKEDRTSKEILALRKTIKMRRISCPDCQKLSSDLIRVLDLFLMEAGIMPEVEKPAPLVENAIHENASVRIFHSSPAGEERGTPGGETVAPGVVIYKADPVPSADQ